MIVYIIRFFLKNCNKINKLKNKVCLLKKKNLILKKRNNFLIKKNSRLIMENNILKKPLEKNGDLTWSAFDILVKD